MVDVDSLKITLRCLKCGKENKVTILQVKRGETVQCNNCGTMINLKDKDGSVAKGTKKVQDALDSLEKQVKKLGGSLQIK